MGLFIKIKLLFAEISKFKFKMANHSAGFTRHCYAQKRNPKFQTTDTFHNALLEACISTDMEIGRRG